jgi:hypothetical protein
VVADLRYHRTPTIDDLGKGIAADQDGKPALHLDLEPLARAFRVHDDAVDEIAEAPQQGTPVILRLRVVGKARGEGLHGFRISI